MDQVGQRLMTVADVSQLMQMSTAWVRQHSSGARQPTIPSLKIGKPVRFRREDVMQFISLMVREA